MFRELGKTSTGIFPVGLGAMPLSMGHATDESVSIALIRKAVASGVNIIDTANVYCVSADQIGHNERLIRKALLNQSNTKNVIIATKDGVNRCKGIIEVSPRFLRMSCLASLKALNQEAIILYQLHSPDDKIPLEESIGELSLLQKEGKIVYVGICNVTLDEILRAQQLVMVTSVQNCCNPHEADDYNNGIVTHCENHGITYFPHSVIGGKDICQTITRDPIIVEIAKRYES
jgi:aryl-alcohol dehydrogenase-like predicted oxidoreductase